MSVIKPGNKIGILFSCKLEEKENMPEAIEHLRNHEELYWSVWFSIIEEKFTFPLIGLINMNKKIVCKCHITLIRDYEDNDHNDSTKKPRRWTDDRQSGRDNYDYKKTIVIDAIEPFDFETSELIGEDNKRIGYANQSYRKILLP